MAKQYGCFADLHFYFSKHSFGRPLQSYWNPITNFSDEWLSQSSDLGEVAGDFIPITEIINSPLFSSKDNILCTFKIILLKCWDLIAHDCRDYQRHSWILVETNKNNLAIVPLACLKLENLWRLKFPSSKPNSFLWLYSHLI